MLINPPPLSTKLHPNCNSVFYSSPFLAQSLSFCLSLPHHFTLHSSPSFQDQISQSQQSSIKYSLDSEEEEEAYGEVNRIIGSRSTKSPIYSDEGSVTTTNTTEFLIEWKDGHSPFRFPTTSIAANMVAEYATPWRTATSKGDANQIGGFCWMANRKKRKEKFSN